jgi:hypothetical protein
MMPEVWTICLECHRPVRLLGDSWHHEQESDHGAVPDIGPRVEVRV